MTAVLTGTYVFGIVPPDTPAPALAEASPAGDLHLVSAGELAALVGRVNVDRPLGRAVDLRGHDRVLADLVSRGIPVLPMRFGAVLTDDEAVRSELLEPNREAFLDAMETVRGRVQYSVKVRYQQDVVLGELLAAKPEIRRLRDASLHSGDPAAKLRLGQLVVQALEEMRPDDASVVLTALVGTADVRIRDAGQPDEVLDAAFLVESARGADFEDRVEKLAAGLSRRMRFTLNGPSAAWDFVGGR